MGHLQSGSARPTSRAARQSGKVFETLKYMQLMSSLTPAISVVLSGCSFGMVLEAVLEDVLADAVVLPNKMLEMDITQVMQEYLIGTVVHGHKLEMI